MRFKLGWPPLGPSLMKSAWWNNIFGNHHKELSYELSWPERVPDSYRGQNANMHMCEACLAAWKATRKNSWTELRATSSEICSRIGRFAWRARREHYTQDWLQIWSITRITRWSSSPGVSTWASGRMGPPLLSLWNSAQSWYQDRAETLYKNGMKDGRDVDLGDFLWVCTKWRGLRPLSIFGFRQSPLQQLGAFLLTEKPDYRDDYLNSGVTPGIIFINSNFASRILREGQRIDRLKSPW